MFLPTIIVIVMLLKTLDFITNFEIFKTMGTFVLIIKAILLFFETILFLHGKCLIGTHGELLLSAFFRKFLFFITFRTHKQPP